MCVDERRSRRAGPGDVEAEPLQQLEVAAATVPEAKPVALGDDLDPGCPQHRVGECLRRQSGQRVVERQQEHIVDAALLEQLQPPLGGAQDLDAVAADGARVRLEGDDQRAQVCCEHRLEDSPMAEVHAVEDADRRSAPIGLELLRSPYDLHVVTLRTSASTTSSGNSRSGANASGVTASATSNGPTAVRRRVLQCPPSA